MPSLVKKNKIKQMLLSQSKCWFDTNSSFCNDNVPFYPHNSLEMLFFLGKGILERTFLKLISYNSWDCSFSTTPYNIIIVLIITEAYETVTYV